MVIDLNSRRQTPLARVDERHDAQSQARLSEILAHCLICGRQLPWLSRMLGATLCHRRECRVEYDQRQP